LDKKFDFCELTGSELVEAIRKGDEAGMELIEKLGKLEGGLGPCTSNNDHEADTDPLSAAEREELAQLMEKMAGEERNSLFEAAQRVRGGEESILTNRRFLDSMRHNVKFGEDMGLFQEISEVPDEAERERIAQNIEHWAETNPNITLDSEFHNHYPHSLRQMAKEVREGSKYCVYVLNLFGGMFTKAPTKEYTSAEEAKAVIEEAMDNLGLKALLG